MIAADVRRIATAVADELERRESKREKEFNAACFEACESALKQRHFNVNFKAEIPPKLDATEAGS